MKHVKSITLLLWSFLFIIACSKDEFSTENVVEEADLNAQYATSGIDKPIVLGYFPSWSESWAAPGQGSKLRDVPQHITHIFLAFAKPNLRYQKGSFDLQGTGIQTPYDGQTLKETVAILKDKGIKVILSIGGETYWGTSAAYDINYQQIKDLVDDMGFEGIDWDYEPNGGFQTIGEPQNIQHFIDFFNNSRAIMPEGDYLLACAPSGVGALGGLNNDDPDSPFKYANRNSLSGESDDNLYNATSPNKAISLFGFGATGHMIPVMKAVGDKIDLIAIQNYNIGAATNRTILYDSYRYYADQYGFSIAAGTHYPNEPWGPYYTYTYETMASISSHISAKNNLDGIMIWQLLLGNGTSSAYGYTYVASQVLNGVSEATAIQNAENYPTSPYEGGGGSDPGSGSGCDNAPQWNSGSVYTQGMQAIYQGKLYSAKWWTQGDTPSVGGPWEFISNCDGSGGNDGAAPQVNLTSPQNNASFTEGETITLTASATDSDGNVVSVSFYDGSTLLTQDTSAPYEYSYTNASENNYQFIAVATDNEGNSTTSNTVNVTVTGDGGSSGGDCNGVAAWQPYPKVYNAGDRTVYNGTIYEAQTGPIWVEPGSGEHWWKTIGTCE
ncbi:Ig-like domain-containing protein [Galbibacter mesophilus]|uniref:Ig-like domain-containing protein n=1 Tax=Galbibacter mesophilus TaxID=379069 RepID=UPI00191CBF0D|nr:Ig-like domain-containing protein [Galbibacter mesophilus]MCM5662983.1 glycosyl hydrolase family 18 protein [Galbibacter mesophilus]